MGRRGKMCVSRVSNDSHTPAVAQPCRQRVSVDKFVVNDTVVRCFVNNGFKNRGPGFLLQEIVHIFLASGEGPGLLNVMVILIIKVRICAETSKRQGELD